MIILRAIALLAISFPTPGLSNEQETSYGVGVALNNSIQMYLPINIGALMVEPTLVIQDRNDESSNGSSDFRHIELGVGLFKNESIPHDAGIYYGVRLGYIEEKGYVNSNGGFFLLLSNSEKDGYFISPAFGTQYFLTNDFSIGLDMALTYTHTKGTATSGGTIVETKSTSYDTEANIIVRYIF